MSRALFVLMSWLIDKAWALHGWSAWVQRHSVAIIEERRSLLHLGPFLRFRTFAGDNYDMTSVYLRWPCGLVSYRTMRFGVNHYRWNITRTNSWRDWYEWRAS